MATTAPHRKRQRSGRTSAWAGIPNRSLAEGDQRPRLHPAELRAVRRRRRRSSRRPPSARRRSGTRSPRCSSRSARRACSTSRRFPAPSPRTRRATSTASNEIIVGLQTDAPLKRAIMPNGGFRLVVNALKTYGYEPDPHVVETFTKYRKTHNDARVRRLHGGRAAMPQLAHPHGTARRLRPRPDHRRLSPRRALRRDPAHRAQAAGEERPRRRHVDRRDHPRSRGAGRADPRAQGAAADGVELRLRHLGPGAHARRKPCSGSTSATWPA